MTSATLLLFATLAACSWPTDARAELPAGALVIDPQAPLDTTALGMSADTYLRQGHPNQNAGTDTLLRVRSNGRNRALLQVDPAALATATGGGTVLAARLELTITANADNWGPDGREIALHRLTTGWTELGATWNCAVDSVPGNQQAECAGETAWEMGAGGPNPWVATPTATLTMTNGLSGVVTFDVTADVAVWLSGTLNAGWILKKVHEGANGRVEFGARESASPPRLVLTVSADTSRPPITDGFTPPANPLLVSPPGDDSVLVLRNFIEIVFDDTTGGSTIKNLFARYGARIAGGDSVLESYIVEVPDPGATYEDLDSLLSRLRREQGVRYALRYVFSEPIRDPGRYPDDDSQQMRREDWLGPPTDGTRALRAIRAPLAWGCETGRYESAPIPVGVIDDIVETTLPDLSPSFTQNHLYRASGTQALDTRDTLRARTLSHGSGVAGVITARGDNDLGVAGLTWQTELHVFRLAREDNAGMTWRLRRRSGAIARAIRLAIQTPIQILHSSVEASADPEEARRLADAIADFVNTPPGRVFVQGGQNYRTTIDPDTASKLRGGMLMEQVMIHLDAAARARTLFVGGANQDGTDIWGSGQDPNIQGGGATLVAGVTDILAPAENILTLVRPQDFGNDSVQALSGTSFAAPMVTGTAALLWAFDPTLTAEQVKHAIITGAAQRVDALGAVETVDPVPNSGDLHLLDAYGALTLAAREDPTTPVCGFPVYTRDFDLYFERVPGAPLPIPLTGFTAYGAVSVAQGGRLLAAQSDLGVVQFRYTGTLDTTLAGVAQRIFLERDTADLLEPAAPDFFLSRVRIRRHDGTETTTDLFPAVEPAAEYFEVAEFQPSPAGDWIAARTFALIPGEPFVFTYRHQWAIVPVGGGGPTVVQQILETAQPVRPPTGPAAIAQAPQETPCGPDCFLPVDGPGTMAWSPDDTRLQFAFPKGTYGGGTIVGRSVMRSVTFPGGMPTGYQSDLDAIEGRELLWPRFTADGALVLNERDVSTGACYRARRNPQTGQLIGEPVATAAADCDRGQDPRRTFNTPPPVTGSQSHAAREGAGRN